MGLLVEAMPKLSTVGYLASRPFWEDPRGAAVREAAKQAGISLKAALLGDTFNEAEYQRVFGLIEQDRVQALMISDDPEHVANRATIVDLAAKGRIPTIYPFRDFVEVGGMIVMQKKPSAYPYPDTPMVAQWGSRKAHMQALFAGLAALIALAVAPHANSPHAIVLLIVLPAALSVVLAFAPSPQRLTSVVTKDLFVLGAALAVFAGPWLGAVVACAPIGLVAGVAIGEGFTRWRQR